MDNGLPSAKPVLPPIASHPEISSADGPLDEAGPNTNGPREKSCIAAFAEATDFVSNPFEYSSTTQELLEELRYERQLARRIELCSGHIQAGLCELTRVTWEALGFHHAKQWAKLESKQDAAVGNWKNLVQLIIASTENGDDIAIKEIVDRGTVTFALSVLSTNLFHPSSYSKFQPQISLLLLTIVYNVIQTWSGGLRTVRIVTDSQATVSKYMSSGDPSVKTLSTSLFFCILGEEEQKKVSDSIDVSVKFIVHVFGDCLRSNSGDHFSEEYGHTALEIMKCLRRIAAADANKYKLVAYGALPVYAKVLKGAAFRVDEQKEACKGMLTLAFSASSRARIAAHADCMEGLRQLAAASEGSLKAEADCALWVIERDGKHAQAAATLSARDSSASSESRQSGDGIRISYHRAIRQQVALIKDKLVASGYNPRMDIEQMTCHSPEAIGQAVDDASIVLIFYTERYKLSSSCRLEAQYANKREKKIIPIKMESDYTPDGWLAVLFSDQVHFDFTQADSSDTVFHDLCSEIQRIQRVSSKHGSAVEGKVKSKPTSSALIGDTKTNSASTRHQDSPSQSSAAIPDYSTYKASEWGEDEVKGWLMENQLDKYLDRFSGYPGGHIVALRRLMDTAPEFFYNSMKNEYGFDMFDMLKFTNMLQSLN